MVHRMGNIVGWGQGESGNAFAKAGILASLKLLASGEQKIGAQRGAAAETEPSSIPADTLTTQFERH